MYARDFVMKCILLRKKLYYWYNYFIGDMYFRNVGKEKDCNQCTYNHGKCFTTINVQRELSSVTLFVLLVNLLIL